MANEHLEKFHSQSQIGPATAQEAPSNTSEEAERWLGLTPQTLETLLRVFLVLAVAAVFRSSLRDNFVAWDDDVTFYQNPHIQRLDWEHIRWMFTNVSYAMRYKPLSWLVYALIYSIYGLNPFGYHLFGLLFHCADAVLLYSVLQRLMEIGFQDRLNAMKGKISVAAALAALLWAVHPLRTEVVARATDMTYTQSLFFALLSLQYYLKAVRPAPGDSSTSRPYLKSVVTFALAMLSYPFVAGYAVALAALDIYPLRLFCGANGWRDEQAKKVWLKKIPFLLLGCLIFATFYGRLTPPGRWAQPSISPPLSALGMMMQSFYVWAYYLWKPWFPFNLSPVYTTLVHFNPLSWPFVASAIGVAALTCVLIWKRREWPLLLTLWVCHLALLVPALGLTEHPHFTSDRYSYVVGILWPALLSAALVKYCRDAKVFLCAAMAALLLAATLGVMSRRQTRIWRDTESLYLYMIAKLGDDPYREDIVTRLGQYYFYFHRIDDAIKEFRLSAQLDPTWPGTHNILGGALLEKGEFDEAREQFGRALQLVPDFADAHNNMGMALMHDGKWDEAAEHFERAIKIATNFPAAENNLGTVLLKQGHVDEAIGAFQATLKLEPTNSAAQEGLNAALAQKNNR